MANKSRGIFREYIFDEELTMKCRIYKMTDKKIYLLNEAENDVMYTERTDFFDNKFPNEWIDLNPILLHSLYPILSDQQ